MSLRLLSVTALVRLVVTLTATALAGFCGWYLWDYYALSPWTRDGRVRAEIVAITPDVAGLVTKVAVTNDQAVRRGQLLFTIDSDRYAIALRQAEAAIAAAQALIDAKQAAITARTVLLAEDRREAARNDGLGALVAREIVDQSHAKVAADRAALQQAEADRREAEIAATQALAARDLAKLNLDRTAVTAPTDGRLADIGLHVGDYVSPGKPVMALVDAHSLRVEGYFEETKLPRLHVGQPVLIHLMGETQPLHGHVDSIAPAIEDRERAPSANLLPNVNPTFNWVRLAQRIPVRIALDDPADASRLIVGRTASVTVIPATGER